MIMFTAMRYMTREESGQKKRLGLSRSKPRIGNGLSDDLSTGHANMDVLCSFPPLLVNYPQLTRHIRGNLPLLQVDRVLDHSLVIVSVLSFAP